MDVLERHHLIIKENMDIAAECQSIAMQIGDMIERCEGIGTKAVSYLEEYCEAVYELYESVNNGRDTAEGFGHMQSAHQKALKCIQKDFNVKLHVVFLPYKREMWDSMESVWQAARADEECVAEVMPIPYYNKNSDGSLGEMLCDAELYDFPVLNWEECDLEVMQPDVIIVHNPYDQYNRVTTVHPYFYMKNLREWTDRLVYIPYFVHASSDTAYKYAVLPGTIYSDIVVMQSEEVRQQYIECFQKEIGKRPGIEERFVALGSPKYDRTGKEAEVPEKWKEYIYRDGCERKVIFFNTHVNCMLKAHSEAFFRKLREVFEVFKKREDVVLLWRPHPLLLSTAMTLNPEAVQPYTELVEYYKTEKIGIYDESPDFRTALEVSDAYYGSGTSIKELFQKTGKPIMILNIYE